MDFARKKLPLALGEASLHPCPVDTVSPFALMLAPVYVPLRANGKFVAIKGPLDFFSPEELERFRSFGQFYFHESVADALPFREVGREVRRLIDELDREPRTEGTGATLAAAPFEIADAILRLVGPLWGPELRLEPFFIAVFANEVCDLLPGEWLAKARERDVSRLELGLLRSSLGVMLSLLLGVVDRGSLNSIRQAIASDAVGDGVERVGLDEEREIRNLVAEWIPSLQVESIAFDGAPIHSHGRAGAKIARRLERVRREFAPLAVEPPSLRGPRGFLNE